MPRIVAVATAVPPYRVDQAQAQEFARKHFAGRLGDISRLMPIFANTGIESRYFSAPVDWLTEPHTLPEKNEVYIQSATDLSVQVAKDVLEQADLRPSDIDYVIYVNTTGLATPSIDARVINLLGMRRDIRRTPIWGLGCAGGAAGLSHAYHHVLGHPDQRVLVIAAEFCGLTFIPDDYSKSNLVASALFGEGAGAVLISGDDAGTDGPQILGTRSTFYPDSLDVMGWNVVSHGLQVVFAQRIPDIVKEHAREDLTAFLSEHELGLNDIEAFIVHPGGTKVMQAYEEALELSNGAFDHAHAVLRDYGNMSSVTVLFVLKRFMDDASTTGGHGLITALGPGFCSESLLVRM